MAAAKIDLTIKNVPHVNSFKQEGNGGFFVWNWPKENLSLVEPAASYSGATKADTAGLPPTNANSQTTTSAEFGSLVSQSSH